MITYSSQEGPDDENSKDDIIYVEAYPVSQPKFLHMWQNHPRNRDAHFNFGEFQPWLISDRMNTTYFTYSIWGAGGPWENGLQELRQRNLITTRF